MSELKKLREERNLTQEELSARSGISVRTIQRIEAGTEPKGYTLKSLASSLEINETKLLAPKISDDKIENFLVQKEEQEKFNRGLIKIINLSSLPFAWFPIANFLVPLLIMIFTKERSPIVKQIISLQLFLAIITPIIFMTVVLLKLGSVSVMITIALLILSNIFVILRNAHEIDRKKKLYIRLNFNLI